MGNYLDLQLFAKSNSSTSSSTQSGETSHTEGGSTSSTSGYSNTETTGHSQTVGHEEGGSHTDSAGKSWASGKVEAQTQAQRDKYNTDYQQGQKAQDAYQRLQDTLDKKPQFQSQYENKLNELYDSIMNRDKFSYDFNADSMYKMYKDKYTQSGQNAMKNAMAQNAALSGGYGNSYAQTVGQQTYQNYLQQLNDMLPTLRNQAYQEYQDENNRMLQQYNLTNDAYNREYGQYRDSVSDWQSDRAFNQSNYQDERNFDYNQFANERGYWNQEYWNEKNAEQSNISSSDSRNWADSTSVTDSRQNSSTNYGETTNSNHWSDSVSNAWSKTNSSTTSYSDDNKSGSKTTDTTKTNTGNGAGSNWSDSVNQRIAQSLAQPGAIASNTTNNKETPLYDNRGYKLNTGYEPTNYYKEGETLDYNSSMKGLSNDVLNGFAQDLANAYTAEEVNMIKDDLRRSGASDSDIAYIENMAAKYRDNRWN